MNVEKMLLAIALISVPMIVWLLLYLTKRNDQQFLSNIEKIFKPLRWIIGIPGAVLSVIAIATDNAKFRWGFGLIAVSQSFGIVHHWVRKRSGIIDAPQEDWWPAKKD